MEGESDKEMTKVLRCNKCKKKTVHKLVGSESEYAGGLGRAFLAVASLGLSEVVAVNRYYECTKCGELKEKDWLST